MRGRRVLRGWAVRLLLACALGAAGCTSIEAELARYHGQPKDVLLRQLGAPDAKETTDLGEVWFYEETSCFISPAQDDIVYRRNGSGEVRVVGTRRVYPGQEFRTLHFRSFYIDSSGMIYDTAYGSRPLQR